MTHKHNNDLFFDKFTKTAFGYIIPNVWYYFCGYGCMPITILYGNIYFDDEYIDILIDKVYNSKPWEDIIV